MAHMNEGHVRPVLRDVSGRLIRDRVSFTFKNLTLASRDRAMVVELPDRKKDLPKLSLPAAPNGLYQVFVVPDRYRSKSLFVRVGSNKTTELESEFFIHPSRARPRFPSFATLAGEEVWANLTRAWGDSGLGADDYDGLSPTQKGTLFNLHAKMRSQRVTEERDVFSFVRHFVRVEEERVFFRVEPALLPSTRENIEAFHFVPGNLHDRFSEGFRRVASFKTQESVGNLQLTFAENESGELEVDADLDDHAGIRHAFDVLRHQLTGDKTDPFDIHEVLIHFQGIDPGYYLT